MVMCLLYITGHDPPLLVSPCFSPLSVDDSFGNCYIITVYCIVLYFIVYFFSVNGYMAITELLSKKGSIVSTRAKGMGVLSLLHENTGINRGHFAIRF